MRKLVFMGSIGLCVVAGAAVAQRGHDAHRHGVGVLNIAFDGNRVGFELEASGDDIVGFEHPPKSAADRAKIDAAIATLAKPLALFRLPAAAQCTLVSAKVELHGDEDTHDGHQQHKDHKERTEHRDHKDHADHKDRGAQTHTEFHATYRLDCAAPTEINRIEFTYFKTFPNAEELEVQMISAKGAKGFEVKRAHPVLDLRGMI